MLVKHKVRVTCLLITYVLVELSKVKIMSQESLNDLIAAGEKLGYAGDDLKNYVSEQQKLQREERAAARQVKKEERNFKLEMERMAQELKMKEMSDHLELSKEEIRQKQRVSDGSVKAGVPKSLHLMRQRMK
jgi:hypothetical protein